MQFLIAAVVVVGVVALLDLVLTVGVVKRLREHTELLSAGENPAPALRAGEEVGAFETFAMDGSPVSRDLVTGETVVAFFSPGCQPCKDKMPEFVRYANTMPGGRDRVLAVVVGDADAAAEFVSELSPVARVVVESREGALSSAFKARAFPTVLMIGPGDEGLLTVRDDHLALDRPWASV
ncbi:TlpA disulfide reductase family protein [Actinosynnema sp. NPDC023587]|uniref:TlpA disulfide reductase family protein n=1 Tax=Actinosynnema sp. NPDC023587 TaxID=3154695 RepID=UPI0033CCBD80